MPGVVSTGGIERTDSALFADNYAGRARGAFWFGKQDLDMIVRNAVFAFDEAGQDIAERHMGYRPLFAGGILECVKESQNRGRVTDSGTFADPLSGELQETDGMLLRSIHAGSLVIDSATDDAPKPDARGAPSDTRPDIDPFGYGVICGEKRTAFAQTVSQPKISLPHHQEK